MNIIERLKELLAKATHGRWRGHDAGPKHDFGFGISSPEAEKDIVDWVRGGKADQALIVTAINALPALLEVAEAAENMATVWYSGEEKTGLNARDCMIRQRAAIAKLREANQQ